MFADRETRLALKIVLFATAVVLLLWALYALLPIISILIIALFIFYFINPVVKFLTRLKFKPILAAIIASLSILIAVFLLFYLLIPGLIIEVRQLMIFLTTELIRDLPLIIAELQELDERFNLQLTDAFIEYSNQFIRQAPGNIQQILRTLTTVSIGLVSRAWITLALVFLVFYLVQELDRVKHNLTLLFPQIYKENVSHFIGTIDEKVGAYVRGTLLKCSFVGLLTWFGLSLLDMPFALMLGILAGALNIILYIGPFAAAVPAVLLSIMPDTPSVLLVIILYIFVQVLDAFMFTPFFLGKATDLSPLTVLIMVLVGAQLMGLLGIVLAIPITATLKVLLVDYYLDRRKIEEENYVKNNNKCPPGEE